MKKIVLTICAALFVFSAAVSAQIPGKEDRKKAIDESMSSVVQTIAQVTPENTSILSIQPDAFIGKFFPAFPPHFCAGITSAVTFIDTPFASEAADKLSSAMKGTLNGISAGSQNITDSFKMDFKMLAKLPVPTAAVSGRIGGIFLPFDIGLFGIATVPDMIKDISLGDFTESLEHTTLGVDLRYAILEGNLILPTISVGAGYIFTQNKAGFSSKFTKAGPSFTYEGKTYGSASLETSGKVDFTVRTHSLYGQLQASKTFLILTPFLGIKTMFNSYETEYGWEYGSMLKGNVNGKQINEELEKNSGSGLSKTSFDNINPQIYGGIGIQLLLCQIGITGAWSPKTNYFTAGLSANFKI